MTATLAPSLFHGHSAVIDIVFEIVVKAAILCLAVWVAHVLAGNKRVLLRSTLWHLCLVGLVLLPFTVAAFPRLHIAARFAETHGLSESRGSTELDRQNSGNGVDLPAMAATPDSFSPADRSEESIELTDAGVEGDKTDAIAHASPTAIHFGELAGMAAVAAYLSMVATLLIRLTVSLAAVVRLRRESTLVLDAGWLSALNRWQSQFALRRPVPLLQSPRIGVPIVIGWRSPAILLPSDLARSTDRQVIDAVLLHELTHVARGDYAWNLLLRIVRAVYWPHPAVWLACHMVRQIREDICDAVCVHWMRDARAYCGILVDVASGLTKRSEVALGMAMTHSSRLGRRLARIEHSRGSARGALGRATRATLAGFVVACVSLLGALQVGSRVSEGGPAFPQSFAGSQSNAISARPADEPDSNGSALAFVDEPPADRAESKKAAAPPDESKPIRVATMKVKRGKLERTTTQPASLEVSTQIAIPARHAGIVSKVLVDIGDSVKEGDVLAELDVPDVGAELADKEATLAQAEAAEEQSKAQVDAARATIAVQEANIVAARAENEKAVAYEKFRKNQYERFNELLKSKAVEQRLLDEQAEQYASAQAATVSAAAKMQTTKADVLKGKADVRVAELVLKAATLRTAAAATDLARTKAQTRDGYRLIRSSIDGVVLQRNVNSGVLVRPEDSKPLFRIAATGLINLVVQLPERDALLAQRGNRATVKFDALEKQPVFAGKISRLAYSLDPTTRTLRAEITLPNAEGRLKPGMYGLATVVIGEIDDVLSVPRSALYNVNGETAACYRAIDGRAVGTTVKLGRGNGEQVEIVEGLAEGDVVVVDSRKVKQSGDPLVDPILLPALPKGTSKPVLLPGGPTAPTRAVVVSPGQDVRSTLQSEDR